MKIAALLVSLLTAAAWAETGALSAPIAGYHITTDPLEVRAILGAPGGTHYSEPFAIPDGVRAVLAAPGHGWLLALRGEGLAPLIWVPEAGVELPLTTPDPDLEAFSIQGGGAVVLYSRAAQRAVVYTGLPEAPVRAHDISTVTWPADLNRLAVNASGTLVAGATDSGEVYVLASGGEPARRLLLDNTRASDMAFWGENALAVIAGGRLLAVDAPLQGTAARELAELDSAAALTPDGAADGHSGRILRIDAVTGEIRDISTEEPFASAASLRWRGALLLSTEPGAPSRILSRDAVSYVPAPVRQPVEAQQ